MKPKPTPPRPEDQPLACKVEGEHLVIRIGIGTLAWAAKKRNGGVVPNDYGVIDMLEWAKDVANAITHEDEIGNTMLAEMLDKAMQSAMDSGSTGLSYGRPRNSNAKRFPSSNPKPTGTNPAPSWTNPELK